MAYKDVILADSPVSYWRLDDTGSSAADSVASNTGTLNGGITKSVAGALAGDPDTAMTLDGGGSTYIQIAYNANLDLSANVTVEAWAKTAVASHNGALFSKTVGGSVNSQYQLFLEAGIAKWRIHSTATDYTIGTGAVGLNTWHHVVGTYDPSGSGTMRIYVDGAQTATAASIPAPNTGNGTSFIGGLNSSTYLFNGQLDEVAVYNTALSANKVLTHYNAGFYPPVNSVSYAYGSN